MLDRARTNNKEGKALRDHNTTPITFIVEE